MKLLDHSSHRFILGTWMGLAFRGPTFECLSSAFKQVLLVGEVRIIFTARCFSRNKCWTAFSMSLRIHGCCTATRKACRSCKLL
jgi:hypothetical protein